MKLVQHTDKSYFQMEEIEHEDGSLEYRVVCTPEFIAACKRGSHAPDIKLSARMNVIAEAIHLILKESESWGEFYHKCYNINASVSAIKDNVRENIRRIEAEAEAEEKKKNSN